MRMDIKEIIISFVFQVLGHYDWLYLYMYIPFMLRQIYKSIT